VDVAISNVHDTPDLFLSRAPAANRWLLIRLIGTRSNRSAIGARVRVVTGGESQVHEVRGGGSYMSQNDLRVHAGLGSAAKVERVEVRWPIGTEEAWEDVASNQVLTLEEGRGKPVGGTR
jgi:enediyne biosynthesis protein E4